jgi:hypothetical protein
MDTVAHCANPTLIAIRVIYTATQAINCNKQINEFTSILRVIEAEIGALTLWHLDQTLGSQHQLNFRFLDTSTNFDWRDSKDEFKRQDGTTKGFFFFLLGQMRIPPKCYVRLISKRLEPPPQQKKVHIHMKPVLPQSNAKAAPPAPTKYKIVFLGDQSVGKTSIITRFMFDSFPQKDYEVGHRKISRIFFHQFPLSSHFFAPQIHAILAGDNWNRFFFQDNVCG